ncbi:hypothetical protein BDEG_26953 [Batrachochytrium dendrobatidis JEL423]|nr:hypothetical protein BDEG_26953 [Batrachochytrium dendrobatidis JEL423]
MNRFSISDLLDGDGRLSESESYDTITVHPTTANLVDSHDSYPPPQYAYQPWSNKLQMNTAASTFNADAAQTSSTVDCTLTTAPYPPPIPISALTLPEFPTTNITHSTDYSKVGISKQSVAGATWTNPTFDSSVVLNATTLQQPSTAFSSRQKTEVSDHVKTVSPVSTPRVMPTVSSNYTPSIPSYPTNQVTLPTQIQQQRSFVQQQPQQSSYQQQLPSSPQHPQNSSHKRHDRRKPQPQQAPFANSTSRQETHNQLDRSQQYKWQQHNALRFQSDPNRPVDQTLNEKHTLGFLSKPNRDQTVSPKLNYAARSSVIQPSKVQENGLPSTINTTAASSASIRSASTLSAVDVDGMPALAYSASATSAQMSNQHRFRRPTLANSKATTPVLGLAGLPNGMTKDDYVNRERDDLITKALTKKIFRLVSKFGTDEDFKSMSSSNGNNAITAVPRGPKRQSSEVDTNQSSKRAKFSNELSLQDIVCSETTLLQASQWKPILQLPSEYGDISVVLNTREVFAIPHGTSFVLEPHYIVEKALPRSYFGILQQCSIAHSFVFDWPEPDHVFFQEIAGTRKSTFVTVREQTTGEQWGLHLKPSKERTNMFGYLCKGDMIAKVIQERADALLRTRKLPLVLDLDDTLVRVVGNAPGRYVPESEVPLVMHRVRDLHDGRKVVLTERVHEFLDWAQKYYEISVCSLGDQPYVDMVVNVLDPSRTVIRGIAYSARNEYMYISQSWSSRRPPKDLLSLFPYCAEREPGLPTIDPIIIDDNVSMWPADQQDNIIVVRENTQSKVWNVSLFPVVQQALSYVHESYFRQLDAWGASEKSQRGAPPTATGCYKEYLRRELSFKIASAPTGIVSDGPTGSVVAMPEAIATVSS